MDWYTNRFSGDQKWFDDNKWRLMYSHNEGGSYTAPETTVTGISNETRKAIAESYEYEQNLNEQGVETYRTTDRLEALASLVSLGTLPEFKGLGSLFKSSKAASTAEDVVMTAAKAEMTDAQLLTRAAQKAEAAVGGTGGVKGTAKHAYAKSLLSRYQSIYGDRGLSLGSNYFNGPAGKGFLDVVNHNTRTIYDFKFGNAVMSNSQFLKYSNSFPGYSIQIIRP